MNIETETTKTTKTTETTETTETPTELKLFLEYFHRVFSQRLSVKIIWGKNQVQELFEKIIRDFKEV